jgi:hypothetical protein
MHLPSVLEASELVIVANTRALQRVQRRAVCALPQVGVAVYLVDGVKIVTLFLELRKSLSRQKHSVHHGGISTFDHGVSLYMYLMMSTCLLIGSVLCCSS